MRASMLPLLATCLCGTSTAAPAADGVAQFPDFGPPPTPHYSGFLDAGAGTMLHYWFATSSTPAWKDAPVVLWLNGGPGSSSILGMLEEHGPLLMGADGKLIENPYAWTTMANLLVIESPAGVGYSFCANHASGCHNTDNSTAADARRALQDFFKTKFPELVKNPFTITGESYAGVYVPTLAREVLDNAPEINMHSIAVGDPCTDNDAQQQSMDMLWYSHKHGFVTDADYTLLTQKCGATYPSALSTAADTTSTPAERFAMASESPECTAANRRFMMSTSKGISQGWALAWLNDLTLYGPAAVVGSGQKGSLNFELAQYMMRPDVKAALHVAQSPNQIWPGPGDHWRYESNWGACSSMPAGTPSMVDFYRYIAPKLQRTVVFNGDTDPCVSYEGTRTAIESLTSKTLHRGLSDVDFQELEGGNYRPWFYNTTIASEKFMHQKPLLFGPALSFAEAGTLFGGHVVDYSHNMSFVTVHGSGHMVPQFRPQAAMQLLKTVLAGAAFAPLLVSEQQMGAMSDSAFDSYLDSWTAKAKAVV